MGSEDALAQSIQVLDVPLPGCASGAAPLPEYTCCLSEYTQPVMPKQSAFSKEVARASKIDWQSTIPPRAGNIADEYYRSEDAEMARIEKGIAEVPASWSDLRPNLQCLEPATGKGSLTMISTRGVLSALLLIAICLLNSQTAASAVGGQVDDSRVFETGAAIAAAPKAPAKAELAAAGIPTSRLPEGIFWIQVASRQSYEEAVSLARDYQRRFEHATVFQSQNGWYAIVVGAIDNGRVESTVSGLARNGLIPQDSYATRGDSFVSKVWPLPEAVAPQSAGEPSTAEAAALPQPERDAAPAPAKGSAEGAELFSPGYGWIAVGEYGDAASARTVARNFPEGEVYRTIRSTFVAVVGRGSIAEAAQFVKQAKQQGRLPSNTIVTPGYEFTERVFFDPGR